jgi:WXG100 family type VII secretion target
MSDTAPYAVDLDLLAATIEALGRCEETCDEALDDVRDDVARLHLTWSGRAADAQAAAQRGWEAGFAQMREGLAAMRAAAATADGNYRAAVEANLAMWRSV